jgi:hypothetical protein
MPESEATKSGGESHRVEIRVVIALHLHLLLLLKRRRRSLEIARVYALRKRQRQLISSSNSFGRAIQSIGEAVRRRPFVTGVIFRRRSNMPPLSHSMRSSLGTSGKKKADSTFRALRDISKIAFGKYHHQRRKQRSE